MKSFNKNVAYLCAVGFLGIYLYHQGLSVPFIACSITGAVLLIFCALGGHYRDYAYPYLVTCLLGGYYVTRSFPDSLLYGSSLFFATAWLYGCFLAISEPLMFIIFSIVSLAGYFLHVEWLFVVTGACCLTNFLLAMIRGQLIPGIYNIWLVCVAIGCGLTYDSSGTFSIMWFLRGILWGSSVFYLVSIIISYIKVKKAKNKGLTYEDALKELKEKGLW